MADIPIERDAVVWARLRMRLCPSLAVTSWGFECCQYHGELTDSSTWLLPALQGMHAGICTSSTDYLYCLHMMYKSPLVNI